MAKANSLPYRQIIEGLKLAASDFSVQSRVLPKYVHLPDEIIMAVDPIYFEQLESEGLISKNQLIALNEYSEYVDGMSTYEDYESALTDLESGEWFEILRFKARQTLIELEEPYSKPDLGETTYVKG